MSSTVCVIIPKSFLHVISQNYFHIPVFLSQLQTTANVTVNGRQVPVTNMSITDATGQIDIALWRDVASAPVAINSTYSFTHLTSSMYNNRRRLCSTRHTTVTVSLISLNTFSVIATYIYVISIVNVNIISTRQLKKIISIISAYVLC